jgi:hypothetical protein
MLHIPGCKMSTITKKTTRNAHMMHIPGCRCTPENSCLQTPTSRHRTRRPPATVGPPPARTRSGIDSPVHGCVSRRREVTLVACVAEQGVTEQRLLDKATRACVRWNMSRQSCAWVARRQEQKFGNKRNKTKEKRVKSQARVPDDNTQKRALG